LRTAGSWPDRGRGRYCAGPSADRGLKPLRGVRLELARRMLADPAALTTVADAAMEAGFSHLGRFAADYRRRFGELLS